MLFSDFLWLFFCIVLLNARPIFKSTANNDVDGYVTNSNNKYISMERQHEHHDRFCNKCNKQTQLKYSTPITLYNRNNAMHKRYAVDKDLNIKNFKIFKNIQDYQKYDDNLLQSQKAPTAPTYNKITKIYGYDAKSILLNDENAENNMSFNYDSVNSNIMEPPTDRSEIMGTAEIEALLNEIKHRELQMIAQQEPYVSELISSTVTETTFMAASHPKSRKMFPGFAISTILSLDKDNKIIIESTTLNNVAIDEKQQHNINHRSLKHDAVTLAYNVENVLQKKCKNVYNKIKKKLSNDYKKEVKKTKATVKEKINKMCTKATARTKGVAKSSKKVHKNITRTTQTPKPIVKTTSRKFDTRKLNKNNLTTTLHSIPALGDDYSMLSVFELLLTKTHENNMMNILSTKNFPMKREIKLEESIENTSQEKTKYEEFDYANIDNNNYNSTTPSEQNIQSESVPEETSFESLSNKISYNDYVNGFKYYLNFQKDDADDQKFSNHIRYQAHKHHKVDDIGKFILNKIPQLPTTRLKRKFVETETLDDQDVSTKSEDSWFKKHFFIFLDRDTPKKFHSVQTVTFKDSVTKLFNKITNFHNSKSITTDSYEANHVTTPMTPLTSKNYTTKKKEGLKKENTGFTNINMEDFKGRYKRKNIGKWNFNKKLRPKRNGDCTKGVEDLKSTLSMEDIGYVDINSVQVTSTMGHQHKNIVDFIFPKFNNKIKKQKRETDLRIPRFNIFKNFKGKQSTARQHLFDYEILSDVNKSQQNNDNIRSEHKFNNEYENNHHINNIAFKIDEMMKQIPNISVDFRSAYPFLERSYTNLTVNNLRPEYHHENIFYNDIPGLGHQRVNSYLDFQDKITPSLLKQHIKQNNKNTEDNLINVNYKTVFDLKNNNFTKKFVVTFPSLFTMTKDSTRKEIDVMRNQVTNVDIDSAKKYATSLYNKNNDKYKGNEAKIKAHPYTQIPISTKSSKEVNFPRNYINRHYLELFNTHDSDNWMMKNLKHEFNTNEPTATAIKDYYKTKQYKPKASKYIIDSTVNDNLKSSTKTKNKDNFDEIYISKFTKSYLTKEKNKHEEENKSNLPGSKPSHAINSLKMKNHKSNKKTGHINTPPEQYFKTPIPMDVDDFNKFLKEANIDVLSVTSPLRDTVSKIVESRISSSKFVPKLTSSQILEQNILKDLKTSTYNAYKRHYDNRDILMKKIESYNADYIDENTVKPNPTRFSHIFKEKALKFTLMNSSLTNDREQAITSTSVSVPKRMRVRGQSFKYDIIFNELNNRNQDIDYDSGIALSAYENINNNYLEVDDSLEDSQRSRKAVRNKNIPPNFIENSRVKYDNWSNLVKKKHGKRDLGERKYFTAKDVAALEVVVDLMKNTQGSVGNEKTKEFTRSNKNTSYTTFLDKENQLNSIQIHIAIPPGVTDRRRSLESVNVRKVFSAIMSTPVDLEYQILTYDETTIAPTTVTQNILSPGLYLLVENTNSTCPKGNFSLKPLSSIGTSNFNIRHATSTLLEKSETIDTMSNTDSFSLKSKETESGHNFTTNAEIKYKRSINLAHTNKNFIRRSFAVKNKKRHIDLNAVKRFFGHDRVCHCSCKANKPMCKPCAESDKVISELMFEFDNLEKYVVDHCTEIQTFFWMNPAGGKKLRSVIHKIDKCLNDYYKRVKGKCQGRTCQTISSNIDKRSSRVNESDHQLLNRLNALFDHLQNIPICHIGNENIFLSGRQCINAVNRCLTRQMHKRSFSKNDEEEPMYSLNNIKINLICNKDSQSTALIPKENIFETNTEMSLYYYMTGKEKEKQKGLKKFLKKFTCRRKSKKYNFNDKNMKTKFQTKDQIEYPLLPKEVKHSVINYFNGNKKYKRMSDFHFKSTQKSNTFDDGTLLTTRAMKSDNEENSTNNSNLKQNIIELFKLSDFLNKRKINSSISINLKSTTLQMYSPTLSSSNKSKVLNSTFKSNQLSTNYSKASSKLKTGTKSLKLKSTNVKMTNSTREVGGVITRKLNVLSKLPGLTFKYLKDMKNNIRHRNNVNGVFSTSTLSKKCLLTQTLKYSEEKDVFSSNNITTNNPTLIIFSDTPCPINNHQYFDINCLLDKNHIERTTETINASKFSTSKPYKYLDNVLNDIQSKSLSRTNSQPSNIDTTVASTSLDGHYDKLHSEDRTTSSSSLNGHYDRLRSLNYTRDLSLNDRSTVKKGKGLINKIAEKLVIKIVPNNKEVENNDMATSTNIVISKESNGQQELHSSNNIQQLGQSKLSTSSSTSVTLTTKPMKSTTNQIRGKIDSFDLNVNILKDSENEPKPIKRYIY